MHNLVWLTNPTAEAPALLSGSISASEFQAVQQSAKLLPGTWEVCLEEDYCGEISIVLLPGESTLPTFLLSRDGAFVRLTSCNGDEHALEGAFGSAQRAVSGAAQRVQKIVGASLRSFREEAGLSVDHLATAAVVDPERLAAWENGDARPTGKEIVALAQALRLSLDQLFSGV